MDDGSKILLMTHQLVGFMGRVGTPTVKYMEVAGYTG